MKRYPDWQLRLEAFVQARAAVPFAWDGNNCGQFAADAVEAQTGEHLCPDLRNQSNAREAMRMLAEIGGVGGLADRVLGERVAPRRARIGDVVAVRSGEREWLGICNGQTAIAPGRDGMVAVPMSQAIGAWRVG